MPIVEAAARFGYTSQDNFTTAFRAYFSLTPGELQGMERKYRNLSLNMKEPLNIMELSNLKQSDLCSTMMSCIKGANDYFDLDWSLPKLYGYSTHAFMVNVHKDLCPSSPYVWNHDRFYLALRNMGMRRSGTVMLEKYSPAALKTQTELRIKEHLDAGKVCIMDFLEHQLIAGYDDGGFLLLKPWNCSSPVELPSLSFASFSEALERKDEGWVGFTFLEKEDLRSDEESLLRDALAAILKMRSDPGSFAMPGYACGDAGWEAWLQAVDKGLGTGHGHWWTGMVWSECRNMAGEFFKEAGAGFGSEPECRTGAERGNGAGFGNGERKRLCAALAEVSFACAAQLKRASDKAAPKEVQLAALAECRRLDLSRDELAGSLLKALAG